MKVIPAIDLYQGQCVRLTKGDYNQVKVYYPDPLDAAKLFEDAGIESIHVVDLEGARKGEILHLKTLEAITSKTNLKVDFGGGINSSQDIQTLINAGAHQVSVGTKAVRNEDEFLDWLTIFGSERIILCADARDGFIAVQGWEEKTTLGVNEFIKAYFEKGVKYILCTDINKDGMMQGPSISLYKEIIEEVPGIELIASGGVKSINDLKELEKAGIKSAVVGKAIYEGEIKLEELKDLC